MNLKRIFILLLAMMTVALSAQNRKALVIGNGDYQNAALRNPVNDATDMASTLKELGFNVMLHTNLNQESMENAIRVFGNNLSSGDVALFYFSGHGTQVNGLNYLIPVGERITAEDEIRYKCVEAGFVLDKMESAGSRINIVILDACRDNPFKGYRSSTRGFAYMSAPTGTIISYSTGPGKVAFDGDGRNSPYTKFLIQAMVKPGVPIEKVFKEVREDVAGATGDRQIPWESSSLMGDFYFNKENVIINIPQETESSTTYYPHESFSGSSGTFTDTRDGRKYKWVRIGEQIWMAENLNYNTGNSWCYDNNSSNCNKYGRLYDWNAALKACPPGWHLPSDQEWTVLVNFLGNTSGKKLKSVSGWNNGGNGTNHYGFSALPGGFRYTDGSFDSMGDYAFFWSSTEDGAYYAWLRRLGCDYADVARNNYGKENGFSVRCLRE